MHDVVRREAVALKPREPLRKPLVVHCAERLSGDEHDEPQKIRSYIKPNKNINTNAPVLREERYVNKMVDPLRKRSAKKSDLYKRVFAKTIPPPILPQRKMPAATSTGNPCPAVPSAPVKRRAVPSPPPLPVKKDRPPSHRPQPRDDSATRPFPRPEKVRQKVSPCQKPCKTTSGVKVSPCQKPGKTTSGVRPPELKSSIAPNAASTEAHSSRACSTSAAGSAVSACSAVPETLEWNDHLNMAYLFKRRCRIFTLSTLPEEARWYAEAFPTILEERNPLRKTTAKDPVESAANSSTSSRPSNDEPSDAKSAQASSVADAGESSTCSESEQADETKEAPASSEQSSDPPTEQRPVGNVNVKPSPSPMQQYPGDGGQQTPFVAVYYGPPGPSQQQPPFALMTPGQPPLIGMAVPYYYYYPTHPQMAAQQMTEGYQSAPAGQPVPFASAMNPSQPHVYAPPFSPLPTQGCSTGQLRSCFPQNGDKREDRRVSFSDDLVTAYSYSNGAQDARYEDGDLTSQQPRPVVSQEERSSDSQSSGETVNDAHLMEVTNTSIRTQEDNENTTEPSWLRKPIKQEPEDDEVQVLFSGRKQYIEALSREVATKH